MKFLHLQKWCTLAELYEINISIVGYTNRYLRYFHTNVLGGI